MRSFRVWIRPDGDFCHVRVDGRDNALRLLTGLSQAFVFKTFDPMTQEDESACCHFLVPYNPPLSRSSFVKMLLAMPGVRLMADPA
jgi:hypothetical protein